jgi:hypothetical protein
MDTQWTRNKYVNQFLILLNKEQEDFTNDGDSGSLIVYQNMPIAIHHRKFEKDGKKYSMASSIIRLNAINEMKFYE